MSQDAETIAVYNAQAQDYKKCMADDPSNPMVLRFLEHLPSGGTVLDLGCGPGDHAAVMAAAGFQTTAIDASAAMVEMASAHPGVEARLATFDEINDEYQFDGIWANFSLLHAPRSEFPAHIGRLAKALKAEGVLHLGMKTGAGEERDSIGRQYAYYSVEELKSILNSAGLIAFDEKSGSSVGLSGDIAPWVILTSRKTGA